MKFPTGLQQILISFRLIWSWRAFAVNKYLQLFCIWIWCAATYSTTPPAIPANHSTHNLQLASLSSIGFLLAQCTELAALARTCTLLFHCFFASFACTHALQWMIWFQRFFSSSLVAACSYYKYLAWIPGASARTMSEISQEIQQLPLQ